MSYAKTVVFVGVITALTCFSIVHAQSSRPTFEVVSIKLNNSGREGGSAGPRGDRFLATNVTVRDLVFFAYQTRNGGRLFRQQMLGGPSWSGTDRFDVQAKMAEPAPIEQVRLMVQQLLQDRFELKVHWEMRDLPVYNLVVTKGGLKMHLSPDQTPPDPRQGSINFGPLEGQSAPLPRGAMRVATGTGVSALIGNSVPLSSLLSLLQGQSDRIVLDKTDLTQLYDFDLRFNTGGGPPLSPSATAGDQSGPSLFTALQELGLRLEPANGLLEVLVIDSVSKPSEN
jgi:uncharacterized protein (TIGR03435 family)